METMTQRGTVYLIDAEGIPWGRAVFTFEVGSPEEFKHLTRQAYEDGTANRCEFGPIGPPWSTQ